MSQHRPEIVLPRRGHKHVPLMEESPCEAIKNNVRGTRLLAQVAEFYGVDRFIFISSDKAVNPTSVMGASKRLAEMAIQTQAMGSVVRRRQVRQRPRQQRQRGAAFPRADPQGRSRHRDPSRHAPVLHADPGSGAARASPGSQAESGGIYVLEMGEQVRLVDMARDLIRLAGFVPEEEIPITFTGLDQARSCMKNWSAQRNRRAIAGREDSPRDQPRRADPDFFTALEGIEKQAPQGTSPRSEHR